MQFSQETQNRIKALLRKDGRCVVESGEDKVIKVRAYPKAKKKRPEPVFCGTNDGDEED